MKSLTKKIKLYTIQNEISIDEFAKQLGVSRVSLYQWMQNKRMPRKRHIQQMIRITNSFIIAEDFIDNEPISHSQCD